MRGHLNTDVQAGLELGTFRSREIINKKHSKGQVKEYCLLNMFVRTYNFIINREIRNFIVDVVETNISTFLSKGPLILKHVPIFLLEYAILVLILLGKIALMYFFICFITFFERAKDHNGRDKHSLVHKHAVHKHAVEFNHKEVDLQEIEILGLNYGNKFRRKIAEALFIRECKSTLNIQEKSVALKLLN